LKPDLVQKIAALDGFAWCRASSATLDADAMTTAITRIVLILPPQPPGRQFAALP
jgi:hypothetical protein